MKAIPTAARYTHAAFGASLVTVGLFFTMQALIAQNEHVVQLDPRGNTVSWVPAKPREPLEPVIQERPEPVVPPDPPVFKTNIISNPIPGPIIEIPGPPDNSKTGINLGNNDPIAVAQITPVYPVRALQDRVEGYVLLEFTVDEKGRVRDILVLNETPASYGFAKAAADAALKFKYNPKIQDGIAVATTGVREKFMFEMEKK